MRLSRSWWTCPTCGTRVPIEIRTEAHSGKLLTVSVHFGETALVDVFAHVWTHTERPEL